MTVDPDHEPEVATSVDSHIAPTPAATQSARSESGPRHESATEPMWISSSQLAAAALATGGGGIVLGVVAWVISTPIAPGQGTVIGGLGVLAAGGITYYGTHLTRLSNERIADATKVQADSELAHEREKLATINERDDIKAARTESREQERALRARFTASAAQLADDSPTIRLAGVFSLSSLADDWTRFGNTDEKNVCVELLRSYIVAPQIQPSPDSDDASPFLQVRARIVHVLQTEQTRNSTDDRRRSDNSARSLLAYTRLESVDLRGADLTHANLTHTILTHANLAGADLTRADLTRADLTGADLTRANLTGANLTFADLTGADLGGADLRNADLTGTDLTNSKLISADLSYANLNIANLTGANLIFTNLTNSYLFSANLLGADLYWADLTGANLTLANLTGADFTNARGSPTE